MWKTFKLMCIFSIQNYTVSLSMYASVYFIFPFFVQYYYFSFWFFTITAWNFKFIVFCVMHCIHIYTIHAYILFVRNRNRKTIMNTGRKKHVHQTKQIIIRKMLNRNAFPSYYLHKTNKNTEKHKKENIEIEK